MPSKTVLSEVEGFTPLIDILVEEYGGVITAAVFGRVWRYCQGAYGDCRASLQTIAGELGLSYATVMRHIKALCADGYLEDKTPALRNKPHTYADTGKVGLRVLLKASLSESKGGLSESKSNPSGGLSESKRHSIREIDEDTTRDNRKKKKKEQKKEDFLLQTKKPDRERIRDVLIDVLADGQIPESDYLLRPFENGVDALVLEFRKMEGKSRLDADLTSTIIAAIRAAYEDDSNWQFNKATSPTRPVIACIVAQGRKNRETAADGTAAGRIARYANYPGVLS